MTSPDIYETWAEVSQALDDAVETITAQQMFIDDALDLIKRQQLLIGAMTQRLRELDAGNVVANANDPRELT